LNVINNENKVCVLTADTFESNPQSKYFKHSDQKNENPPY